MEGWQQGGFLYLEVHLDAQVSLTGLALRLHFDPSQLTFSATEFLASSSIGSQTRVETIDHDSDPATSAYRALGWSASAGGWPGAGASHLLARLRFAPAGAPATTVRITAVEHPPGYTINAPAFDIPTDLD
jgi:hypothetical protein